MTKEEKKIYMKAWRENHKEEMKLYNRLWQENHKEEMELYMKKYNKKYYEKHKEDKKLYNKMFRENHKDYVNKIQNDRINRTSFAEKHKSRWTSEEELYLKTNAPYKTAYEIALELGRSELAVSLKACRLSVSLNKYN